MKNTRVMKFLNELFSPKGKVSQLRTISNMVLMSFLIVVLLLGYLIVFAG